MDGLTLPSVVRFIGELTYPDVQVYLITMANQIVCAERACGAVWSDDFP